MTAQAQVPRQERERLVLAGKRFQESPSLENSGSSCGRAAATDCARPRGRTAARRQRAGSARAPLVWSTAFVMVLSAAAMPSRRREFSHFTDTPLPTPIETPTT